MSNNTIVKKIVVGTPIPRVVEVGFDSADVIGIVDSDYIQARQVDFYRDSAFVTTIVDSDYIQVRQIDLQRDSAFVTGIIDSDYIQARQVDFYRDSAFVTDIVDTVFDSPVTLSDLETTGTSVIFNNLPTTDPLNAGQLWRDSSLGSVLRVSTGTSIAIDLLVL